MLSDAIKQIGWAQSFGIVRSVASEPPASSILLWYYFSRPAQRRWIPSLRSANLSNAAVMHPTWLRILAKMQSLAMRQVPSVRVVDAKHVSSFVAAAGGSLVSKIFSQFAVERDKANQMISSTDTPTWEGFKQDTQRQRRKSVRRSRVGTPRPDGSRD